MISPATVIRAASGFGEALVAVPLLARIIPAKVAARPAAGGLPAGSESARDDESGRSP